MCAHRLHVAKLVLVLAAGLLTVAPAIGEPVVFARHLALSPDGRTLAFSWAGDVWTVPTTGGLARRLTVNPAHDSYPVWSRDGRQIAFSSDRYGTANVFVMTRDGGEVHRLTFSDCPQVPTDWSLDGNCVYLHSRAEGQQFREPKVYRVPAGGGQSWRAVDCYAADCRLSPDGKHLAFSRGGSKWWRRGYRGSANHDIWLHELQAGRFFQLTDFDGTDRLPAWDGEARGIYFLSDRGGTVNVWYQPIEGGAARQITHLAGGDVRDLSVSLEGRTLAFTHWDKLYIMSLPGGEPREIEVNAGGDLPRERIDLRRYTNNADESEASPDGKEIALVVHGEIFVIKTEERKPTRRVTRSPYRDHDVAWSPDGRALFFVSDRAGQEDIYRATSAEDPPKPLSDSLRFKIERVTDNPEIERYVSVSPDGKKLAFVRGRGDLHIRDLTSGEDTLLVESWNAPSYRWSPDSKWMAYEVEDEEYNPDVWIVPADGGAAAVNITQHPDSDTSPQWSADGQILAFTSRRAGFDSDLYLVFLSRELDEKSSVDLADYFKEQADKVKKRKPVKDAAASGEIALASAPATTQPETTQPTTTQAAEEEAADRPGVDWRAKLRRWVKSVLEEPHARKKEKDEDKQEEAKEYAYELETAYRRIRRVTSLPSDQSRFALSPDGSLLAFSSAHGGSTALYTIKWDGKDTKRIVSAGVGALRWGLTGQRLYYLKGGVPGSCKAGGSDAKSHSFSAKMAVVHAEEAVQKFFDAARMLGLHFYHPTLKGLDWPTLTEKYASLALQTQTVTEFNEVFDMLQGELNGSHLGISGPGGRSSERIGYLGCDFDPSYPGPGLRVTTVTPDAPADRAESKLVPGDIILKVNYEPVGRADPINRALIDTVGDPVIIEYIPSPKRAERKEESPAPATKPAPNDASTQQSEWEAARKPSEAPGEELEVIPETEQLVIRPTSYWDYANLQYQAWVDENAAHVEERSDGRLGYCHIRGMGESSFHAFERDLYAVAHGKDGLVIDVRNNGGGWTADWVLAVLNVRRHAYTASRGGEPGYPQGRLIFYAWTKPATMLCNQYSFSNAEIISHAFKNLDRGPLVGMTTFGAVISTGSYGLIDGAYIRMPTRGWYTLPNGVDMENNGAVPDVLVPVTPEDEVRGRRPQLDAAIEATLEQIARARPERGRRPEAER
jgi:tricorn protease